MNESLVQTLVESWGPMIVLMAVWLFYMRRYGGRTTNLQTRQHQHMERVESLLERIAISLAGCGSTHREHANLSA
jgi:hypothetical protein